jgi:hypothetical protein
LRIDVTGIMVGIGIMEAIQNIASVAGTATTGLHAGFHGRTNKDVHEGDRLRRLSARVMQPSEYDAPAARAQRRKISPLLPMCFPIWFSGKQQLDEFV